MKRVLFVYPWQDLFSDSSGASWRASNSARALASKYVVDVISFADEHICEKDFNWHVIANESRFEEIPGEATEERHHRFLEFMFQEWLRDPLSLQNIRSLEHIHPDIVFLNYPFISDLIKDIFPTAKLIIDTHDLFFIDRSSKPQIASKEKHLLEIADSVITCSVNDYKFLKSNAIDSHLIFHPQNMSAWNKAESRQEAISFTFLGSAYVWNLRAAVKIAEIAEKIGDRAVFHLIGECGVGCVETSNLKIHRGCDDDQVNQLLSNSDYFLNLLEGGGGASVKILRALSCGVPVISTTLGLRGYGDMFDDFVLPLENIEDAYSCIERIVESGERKFLDLARLKSKFDQLSTFAYAQKIRALV